MSLIPMIGGRLERRQNFCEHHKIPQIVTTAVKCNPAIRLQEMSRLRKLGGGCRECNENVCSCLWTRYVEKSKVGERKPPTSSPVSDYTLGKSWSIRNQLFDKIRAGYSRCTNKKTTPSHKELVMYRNDSLIWLLRPTKNMHHSETNICVTKKKVRQYQQDPDKSSPPYKHQQDPGSTVTHTYDYQAHFKIKASELPMPKGTKEHFNKSKRRSGGRLKRQPLMDSELEQAICNERGVQTTALYSTSTKLKQQNQGSKKLVECKKNEMLPKSPSSIDLAEDYIEKLLNPSTEPSEHTSSVAALSTVRSPIASKCNCMKSELHTKCNNQLLECNNQLKERKNRHSEIGHRLNKSMIESSFYEMPSRQDEDTTSYKSTSRESLNRTYFSCSKIMVIKDYICSKWSETHPNLKEIQPERRVHTSTQTLNTSQVEDSTSSMDVNCTDSFSRMDDFIDIPARSTGNTSDISSTSTNVATTTKPKLKKNRKQKLSKVKKPRSSELSDVCKSKITEDIKATSSMMPQSSESSVSEVSQISEASTSKISANELSQVTNSEILHKKNLIKHKKFVRKRFRKQNTPSSSQSTSSEEVDKEEESPSEVIKVKIISKHSKTPIDTKSSLAKSSTQPKRLSNVRRRRTSNKSEIQRQPAKKNITPDPSLQSKPVETKQPSLVTVSNETCTYSFHRPIRYDELYRPYDSCNHP